MEERRRKKELEEEAQAAKDGTKAQGGRRKSLVGGGWAALRQRRSGGMAAAALAAAGIEASRKRRLAVLDYGIAPRKAERFDEWSTIPLSDFERLVSMFGDWMHDEEMSRNHGDLGKLFEALDAPGADEDDSFSFGADDSNKGDDVSKLSAPQLHGLLVSLVGRQEAGPLQRTNGTPAAQQRQQMQLAHRVRQAMQDAPLALVDEAMHRIGEALREEQRKREEEGSGKRVDLANFESFLRKLRPLAPGERDGDAELMALAESLSTNGAAMGEAKQTGKRQPAWMSAVRSSISIDRFSMQRAQAKQASEMAQAANALTSLLGDGKIDVLGTLEASTKSLIPLAHMSTIRLILSNLRSAGFQPVESNVLLRALYSFSDEKYEGPTYREEAWILLREFRLHLRDAADALANDVGEFRTEERQFKLPGIKELRMDASSARTSLSGGEAAPAVPPPPPTDGLREDEFQFLISLLGEQLGEGQLNAIHAGVNFEEDQVVSFYEVGRILRFMYGVMHTKENVGGGKKGGGNNGSILQNEAKAKELEAEVNGVNLFAEVDLTAMDDASKAVGGAVGGAVDKLVSGAKDLQERWRVALQAFTYKSPDDVDD